MPCVPQLMSSNMKNHFNFKMYVCKTPCMEFSLEGGWGWGCVHHRVIDECYKKRVRGMCHWMGHISGAERIKKKIISMNLHNYCF